MVGIFSPVSRSTTAVPPAMTSYVVRTLPMLVSDCHSPARAFRRANAALVSRAASWRASAARPAVAPSSRAAIVNRCVLIICLLGVAFSSLITNRGFRNRHGAKIFFGRCGTQLLMRSALVALLLVAPAALAQKKTIFLIT